LDYAISFDRAGPNRVVVVVLVSPQDILGSKCTGYYSGGQISRRKLFYYQIEPKEHCSISEPMHINIEMSQ
jgi:hypothetical protein